MTAPEDLLGRAARLLRLPSSPDREPEVVGAGLVCPATGRAFPFRDGVLDLLPEDGPKTLSQWSLDTAPTAWLYDRARDGLLRLGGLADFPTEVARIQSRLGVVPGDAVVDLACGHGNFTLEWARLAGPDGLVLGLDLSRAMLARAAARTARSGLSNVLLIHGDAQRLPIATAAVRRVNCSGGFHAFPDLPLALREIARISAPGGVLTASMFALDPRRPWSRGREWLRVRLGLHFVPLGWLGEQLAAAGFEDYRWSVPKAGFGYASAVRAGPPG
jgi:ubiquinone/menaquinone biosynthesis C-methylase UbiE/uncharacterized protein YbaR (Trm112 family)